LADGDSSSVLYPRNLAVNYTRTGKALAQLGSWAEAEEAVEKALSISRKLINEHPSSIPIRSRLAWSLKEFALTLWKGGRTAEAVAKFDQERSIRQHLVAEKSASVVDRDQLADCETNAAALITLGRLPEARASCDRAIAIREDLVKGDPKNHDYARGLALTLLRSGSERAASGDVVGATRELRRSTALYDSHPTLEPAAAIGRACCQAALTGMAAKQGSGIPAAEGASQAEAAIAILQQAVAGGYRDPGLLRLEPGLDPLRSRDDFRLMMMDQTFPAEPFARQDRDRESSP
jgi:tetratricopeptide (TPR) repeat protein